MIGARFLRLLNAELEDCEEDLRDLDELLRQRLATREITDYVFWENDALLQREIRALESIRAAVGRLQMQGGVAPGDPVEKIASAALQTAQAQVVQHEYPLAVLPLIERRIQRIRDYLGRETLVV